VNRRPVLNTRASKASAFVGFLAGFIGVLLLIPATALVAPPFVATGSASVTDTGATMEGRVNPQGSGIVDCHFDYGTTTQYGAVAPCVPAVLGIGSEEVPVNAETADLEPGSTYHFRLVAFGPGGSSEGIDQTFTTTGTSSCPNAAVRLEQGIDSVLLPDCMALEQVSPAEKGNQLARFPGPISADGKRLVFNSFATLDPGVPNYDGLGGDFFLATRGGSSWVTQGANLPYGSAGGVLASPQVSFSPDLLHWLQVVQDSESRFAFLRAEPSRSFEVLSPRLKDPIHPSSSAPPPFFLGASTDQSHIYFKPDGNNPRTGAFLLSDPQPEGVGEDSNFYVVHLGSNGDPLLELAARDLNGKAWGGNCGARLGGMESLTGINLNLRNGSRNQGAISRDGSRIYFSTRPDQPASGNCTEANRKRIMVREEAPAGPSISELIVSECDRAVPACNPVDGDDAYQGASVDQSKVYFTTTRQLSNSDHDSSSFTGTGTTVSGSKSVSSVITATGNGTLTSGSKSVSGVTSTTGEFRIGQRITGTGIPASTTIAAIGPGALELSANATVSGSQALSAGAQPFAVGQTITGSGIAPGTTITAVNGQTVTLSAGATASASGVTLAGAIPACDIVVAVPGCDLYLYDSGKPVGERLTQVSAGEASDPTPGSGANLYNSITAISADGSRVYFVAQGVLTTDPSPQGTTAVANQPNLYTWNAETGDTAFIGTLNANDGSSGSGLWGTDGTWNNGAYPVPIAGQDPQAGGDGHILLFKSAASLTADDTDGTSRDVYRYDADSGELMLISKPAAGGAAGGDASPMFGDEGAPLGTDYAAIGRPISEDGQTVEFTTTGSLIPADTNGSEDVYLWRGGKVYQVPGSTRAVNTPSNKPLLSADGSTLAYHTVTQLLPSDGDSALDVYVARIDGGYTTPQPLIPCVSGVSCQAPPSSPPPYLAGSPCTENCGSVKGKLNCLKGKVRRHGRCVRKPSRKRKKGHLRNGQRVGTSQGETK
jgi:hypothetical protein